MDDIIEEYINNYYTYDNGKITFERTIGTITFIKDKLNRIIIFEIYIKDEFRRMSYCKNFLNNLILKCKEINFNLHVVSVLSKILYNLLLKLKFKIDKDGFIYKIK